MTHTNVLLLAVALVAVLAAGYAVACWANPFTRCWRCRGDGQLQGAARVLQLSLERRCHRCRGTGRARRLGRTAWENWRAIGRAADAAAATGASDAERRV